VVSMSLQRSSNESFWDQRGQKWQVRNLNSVLPSAQVVGAAELGYNPGQDLPLGGGGWMALTWGTRRGPFLVVSPCCRPRNHHWRQWVLSSWVPRP
jgi:hypothetical protein